MTISHFDRVRVEYGSTNTGGKYRDTHFFDVQSVDAHHGYAASIGSFEEFGYCAVIKTHVQYSPHRIVFFPNKVWFDDWIKGQDPKPEVLWACGREKENG